MSISSIENLSNEFFYEIFEYFDGCEIYNSFSNLNSRFQQLLNSSSLLLKLKLDYSPPKNIFMDNYQQIFHHHKNQIFSIHLWTSKNINQIISAFIIESSFNRLESLVFDSPEPDILMALLPKLTYLPRLFSLTIESCSSQKDLGDIYQFIFNLPKLRYMKLTEMESNDFDITVSLPMATNEQISTIEYLSVNHSCAVDKLFSIISYTPQLRRLKYLNLTNSNVNIRGIEPMTFSNLTQLSIQSYEMSFNQFKIFISKLNSKLKILSLTTVVEDITFLDANRWEEFILKKLLQLEKLYFKYTAHFDVDYATPMYSGDQNQFISSFWLERRWILEAEIDFDNLIYSISPYKKRWYEYDTQDNSIDHLSKSIQFIADSGCPEQWSKSICIDTYINHVLTVTQIYHLELQSKIDIGKLNEILYLLPEVNSLKLSSLLISKAGYLSQEEIEFLFFLSSKKQITKICFQNMNKTEQLYMLVLICPHVKHLQINCINYQHAELLAGLILTELKNEANHSLRSLCFSVTAADDDMIDKLEEMIHMENLLVDFGIKHIYDKIYLTWK